ncbi:uncharacterized protein LOC142467292 [Ascaphus truei]|uniref:uncharacterized protein LOC142467292 n=1 Tax=Ascaphus truei TaxID=8439 RepID=UPI003F5ACFF7
MFPTRLQIPLGRTISIPKNRTISIPKNRTISIPKNRTISIPKNRTLSIPKNRTISIPKNRTISIPKNRTISIPKNRTISIRKNRTLSIPKNRRIKLRRILHCPKKMSLKESFSWCRTSVACHCQIPLIQKKYIFKRGDRVKHEVSLDAKQKDDCNGSTNCEHRSAQLKDNSTFNTDVLSSIKKEQDSFRYPLISEQGISQPPNKRGRPALTPQLRLIRRKETNKMAHDQRINIGSAFDDWMAVKNEKCLIRHEQVAMHLIDTYRQFMTLCEETVCAELGVEGSEALGSPSFDEYVPGPSQFCMTVSPKEMWVCSSSPSDSYIAAPFTGTSRNSDDSEEEFELCENQN